MPNTVNWTITKKKTTTTTTTKMENKNITANKKSGAFFTVPRNALRHRSRCQPHQSTHTHTPTVNVVFFFSCAALWVHCAATAASQREDLPFSLCVLAQLFSFFPFPLLRVDWAITAQLYLILICFSCILLHPHVFILVFASQTSSLLIEFYACSTSSLFFSLCRWCASHTLLFFFSW